MKIIRNISEIQEPFITIYGNFDGMHKGHEYLIRSGEEFATSCGAKVCIVTFTPHPTILFSQNKHFLITSVEEKQNRARNFNVDYYYEIPFSKDCAALSASTFLETYIESPFLKGMFVGYDFALGKNRQGNIKFLQNYCKSNKLKFDNTLPFYINRDLVSSSFIRSLIARSDFQLAKKLLGYSYLLKGKAIRGKGLGRTIGIPTINVTIDETLLYPKQGVYRVDVLIKNMRFLAVTNVGTNPTTDNDLLVKIETHIIDNFLLDVEIQEDVEIHFVQRIRDERKFKDLDELKLQIERDIEYAKKIRSL